MSIFIGDNFMIISGGRGDAIFRGDKITIALHKHVNDVVLDATLGCAEIALMMIGV